MKKLTSLFALMMILSFGLNAQIISFEGSEGYTLGDINGQNNWTTTGDGSGGFIKNQIITNEEANDGVYSLKLTKETGLPGQLEPYVGAIYNYPTPISTDAAVFSADIYLHSPQDITAFVSVMGLLAPGNIYRTYIRFLWDGKIDVYVYGGPTNIQLVYTGVNWEIDTWFNIKIETTGQAVKFYKDNVEIYDGTLVSDGSIAQVCFIHDNYLGDAYIDNFSTNGTPESIFSPNSEVDFTYFYNSDAQTLVLETPNEAFDNVFIYNILGQAMISKDLSQNIETIDVRSLTQGVYIVQCNIGNSTQSFKFVKE
ncbi:MAG: T9SS type A sorting domain-containing protein [Bacteroidales bacterium]|nr:T9SS type A sorting domain-containing protein [Bacteroidales bacterium]